MKLRIKVKPSSKADAISRESDGSLKLKIKAPPVEGKANKYLIEFLSEMLELSKSKIVLLKGESNSFKTLEVEADEKYVTEKLEMKITQKP